MRSTASQIELSTGIVPRSLERHVHAFRDIGTQFRIDDDAAAYSQRGIVAGPHRMATRSKNGIGVRRPGFRGVKRIAGVVVEDARLFYASAVGVGVDHFLIVPRQGESDAASEIFSRPDVEDVGVRFTNGCAELSRPVASRAGNILTFAELEFVRICDGRQHCQKQTQANNGFT
jgi:hypothetical protein